MCALLIFCAHPVYFVDLLNSIRFGWVGLNSIRLNSIRLGCVVLVGVNSDLADAWAAIICSVTIFVTIVPLVGEIGNVVRTHFRTVAEKQNEISVHYT